jgi:hypothetical protein
MREKHPLFLLEKEQIPRSARDDIIEAFFVGPLA